MLMVYSPLALEVEPEAVLQPESQPELLPGPLSQLPMNISVGKKLFPESCQACSTYLRVGRYGYSLLEGEKLLAYSFSQQIFLPTWFSNLKWNKSELTSTVFKVSEKKKEKKKA